MNKPEERSLSKSSMKQVRVGGYRREVQAVIEAYQHAFVYLIRTYLPG